MVVLVALITNIGSAHAVDISSGSGVVRSSASASAGLLVARDEKNDLAVVQSKISISSAAKFRDGAPVRAGDAVVALGYPLSGLLATTANLSVGNVSALAGLNDDGHLVGIITAKLNALRVARLRKGF